MNGLPKTLSWGFIAAIVLQIAVLVGMTVTAAMPQWTGQELRMKTVPVDPRSWYRGNYARLSYGMSRVPTTQVPESAELRHGEVVYAVLVETENQLYDLHSLQLQRPSQGLYIRGRVDRPVYLEKVEHIQVNYGIEAFFAPKEKALALEKQLVDGGVAVLKVSPGGKALLMDVVGEQ